MNSLVFPILLTLLLVSGSSSSTTGAASVCEVGVQQTLSNSWTSNNQPYSQYDVLFTNNGAIGVNISIELISAAEISQSWIVSQVGSSNVYNLPSYLQPAGLLSGQQLTWGYILASASPATIKILAPASCTSSSTPSSTSSGSLSSTTSSIAQVCSTSVVLVPTSNEWEDSTYRYVQYGFNVVNTGSRTAFATLAKIYFSDGEISQYWNMAPQSGNGPNSNWQITLFELQPQQSFSGAGLIWRIPLTQWDSIEQEGDEQAYAAPYSVDYLSTSCE